MDDGDAKTLRARLRVEMEEINENFEGIMEDKVVAEIMLPLSIIDDVTRHVITNMLDCVELSGESNTSIVKVMPKVEYDKHIFKANTVSQLNASPLLSKAKKPVRFGCNVGVFLCPKLPLDFLQHSNCQDMQQDRPPKKNTPTSVFQGVDNGMW